MKRFAWLLVLLIMLIFNSTASPEGIIMTIEEGGNEGEENGMALIREAIALREEYFRIVDKIKTLTVEILDLSQTQEIQAEIQKNQELKTYLEALIIILLIDDPDIKEFQTKFKEQDFFKTPSRLLEGEVMELQDFVSVQKEIEASLVLIRNCLRIIIAIKLPMKLV